MYSKHVSLRGLVAGLCVIALCCAADQAKAFEYFYTDPGLPGANQYIESLSNVEISQAGGIVRFYQVSRGGPNAKTGTIVYKFETGGPIMRAELLSNAPVWTWSYGNGSTSTEVSKDGVNWVEVANAPVPAGIGQSNGGAFNGELPAEVLGGNNMYVRITMNNWSNTPQFFRDTAQHSRALIGGANPVFRFAAFSNAAPLPGGGGTSFDPGPPVVFGDPGTAHNDLSQQHKLSAQSLAGSEAIHRTNTITRTFTFSRDDGMTDPTEVFISAFLDGYLQADNGGMSKVDATFRILDMNDNQVGGAFEQYTEQILTSFGQDQDSNVAEVLQFSELLVPGQTYKLESTLSVWADAMSEAGGARAFFDNTFEVTMSGVPEPASLALLTFGAMGVLRRRR